MKRVAVLFALFIVVVVVVVLADTDHLPGFLHVIYDFPGGDKVGHFVLFGLLNLLTTSTVIRSFADRNPRQLAASIGSILAILIGLEEFSQKLFVARTFDLVDLLASYLGLIAGGWMAIKQKDPKGFKNL